MLENGTETSQMEKEHTTILMETGQVHHIRLCSKTFYRFEGLLKDGNFEGQGKFFFGSLDKYDGDFSEGK